ncbi:helix-turn-helix domain-containing protein [Spirosoma koreense]
MLKVPSYEEFEALLKRIDALEREVRYLRQNEVARMTIDQTIKALQVSKMTLHRLVKEGKLVPQYEGKRPMFDIAQLREYIQSKRVSPEAADKRVLSALQNKK